MTGSSASSARCSQDAAPPGLGRVEQVRALAPPPRPWGSVWGGGCPPAPLPGSRCHRGAALVWRLLSAAPPPGHRFAVSQTSLQAGGLVPFYVEGGDTSNVLKRRAGTPAGEILRGRLPEAMGAASLLGPHAVGPAATILCEGADAAVRFAGRHTRPRESLHAPTVVVGFFYREHL